MTTQKPTRLWAAWLTSALVLPVATLSAQTTDNDGVVELTPFEIRGGGNEGYGADATLASSRIRTDLEDLSTSLSVVTDQFLQDTGATDSESLLTYTTNTEVGGLQGNFAGLGNVQGISENARLPEPSTNTRVRGLDAADNTRNNFLTDIPWDSYNVDRVELQRGPNSILFGVGSPAGIINVSTASAFYDNAGEVEFRFDGRGSTRSVLDYNREIIEGELAVRLIGLYENTRFQQRPADETDKRFFVAARYEPRLFGDKHSPLTIRGSMEFGDIESNRPRILPPNDSITPWYTELDQGVFDPSYSWGYGQQLDRGTRTSNDFVSVNAVPALKNDIPGLLGTSPVFMYNNGASAPFGVQQIEVSDGVDTNGDDLTDYNIGGFVFARPGIPSNLNEFSKNTEALNPGTFPAANSDFYKDRTLTDTGIFNFYDNLIDGDSKREWNEWEAYNVSVAQTFFENRLGAEFVYDRQDLTRGREGLFSGTNPFLAVDLNSHYQAGPGSLIDYPDEIPPNPPPAGAGVGGNPNPNAGRVFISGNSGAGNEQDIFLRENLRGLLFAEFRASDIFEDDSFLERLIGRHIITGLISRDDRTRDRQRWRLFAVEESYAAAINGNFDLTNRDRVINPMIYLTDDLRGVADPSTINVPRVDVDFNPTGSVPMSFFDPTPNVAPGFDLTAPWINPTNGDELTERDNPANYVGWTTQNFQVLNANEGDRDALTFDSSQNVQITNTLGVTWQGYFMDDLVVPTLGWRQDQVRSFGNSGTPDVFPIGGDANRDELDVFYSRGHSVSWGIVLHSPDLINDFLPYGTRFSLFYNNAENFQAENRVAFSTDRLPNAEGTTREYGFAVNTFDDRLRVRVTWYRTEVTGATLPGSSPLGANSWYLYNQEAWGTAAAIIHETWRAGEAPGMGWYSNWANPDGGFVLGDENLPPEGLDHPSFVSQAAAIADWYATMPDQSYFDAYGFPIDVAAAQSSDPAQRRNAVTDPNWSVFNGIGGIQPAGGGLIDGIAPVIAVDQISTGFEMEMVAQPMDNWNFTLNVAKVQSARGDIDPFTVQWIESRIERYAGPAGDIRQWWAGDRNTRQYFDDFVVGAYEFQLEARGQSAPEVRPWRVNAVSTYTFQEGRLAGLYAGGGYRWQDAHIIGYELNDALDNLDPTRPLEGETEQAVDLWVGYTWQISDALEWQVQLNMRNVGQSDRLVPISINPDGQVAASRIADGQSWFLTNTLRF